MDPPPRAQHWPPLKASKLVIAFPLDRGSGNSMLFMIDVFVHALNLSCPHPFVDDECDDEKKEVWSDYGRDRTGCIFSNQQEA